MIRKLKHNKKFQLATGAFLICAVLVVAFLIYKDQQNQKAYRIANTDLVESEHIYTIKYNGDYYDYNNSIETVLLIGTDSRGAMKAQKEFGVDARADNIDLIIMDRRNRTVKILPVSRDTMTEIMKYSRRGYEAGSYTTHLGYAFSYGNGGAASCRNVCDAVSYLLYNIDVRYYVCTNLDSIAFANRLAGGVEVEVPNSDLTERYPEFTEGNRVTLTDDNVEAFLRSRTGDDFSNNGRMQRQQAFLDGFVEKVKSMDSDDYLQMWKKLNSKDSNILTNMHKTHYLKIIDHIGEYEYNSEDSNISIEGTDKIEDEHDVFYPDEKKLKKLVVETFYIKR